MSEQRGQRGREQDLQAVIAQAEIRKEEIAKAIAPLLERIEALEEHVAELRASQEDGDRT
ncbi:hypothetical protein BH20ACT11_BH20ACT11_10110 [soil metagenome]|jgi:tetrahydromethanopterin S-methyltransferase subunit B